MRAVLVIAMALATGTAWGQLKDDAARLRAIRQVAFLSQHAEQCGLDPAKVNAAANRVLDKVTANLAASRLAAVRAEAARGEREAMRDPLKQGSPSCDQVGRDLAELGERW